MELIKKLLLCIFSICLAANLCHADLKRFIRNTPTDNAHQIYVATDGDNGNLGTLAEPLATMEAARDAARTYKDTYGMPDDGIIVNFRGGNYYHDKTIWFNSYQDGEPDKPVIYRSYPGESARIIGGRRLDNSWFVVVDSDDPGYSRLDPAIRSGVYSCSLARRVPDVGYMYNSSQQAKLPGVYVNTRRMTIARWPNSDIEETQNNFVRAAGGDGGLVVYHNENRTANWHTAMANGEAYWAGYPDRGYVYQFRKIVGINDTAKSITVSANEGDSFGPKLGYVGVKSNYPWCAVNILEELDMPGEFFIDRINAKLYLYPPEGVDMSNPETEILFTTNGISDSNHLIDMNSRASNIIFRDLTFELSGRNLLLLRGCNDIIIDRCVFRNANNGINLANDGTKINQNCVIQNCTFYNFEGTVIVCDGGDKQTLTPGNNIITNNEFYQFALWHPQYRPAIWMPSAATGNIASHNYIHHSPGSGMFITGPMNLVEYNQIEWVMREGEEMGLIYAAGDPTSRGRIFRHNLFKHTHTNFVDYVGYYPHGISTVMYDFTPCDNINYGNMMYDFDTTPYGFRGVGGMGTGTSDHIFQNNFMDHITYGFFISTTTGAGFADYVTQLQNYNYDVPGSPWYEAFWVGKLEYLDSGDYKTLLAPARTKCVNNIGWEVPDMMGEAEWWYEAGRADCLNYGGQIENNHDDIEPAYYDEAGGVLAMKDDWAGYDTVPDFERLPWELMGMLDYDKSSKPVPPNGYNSTQSSIGKLYWASAFGAASRKVYFGTHPNNLQLISDTVYEQDTSFLAQQWRPAGQQPVYYSAPVGEVNVSTELSIQQQYYWRVDDYDPDGNLIGTGGDVWLLATKSRQAYNPSPDNGTTDIAGPAIVLGWDPGEGAVSHDVYFGTNPTPGPAEFKDNQTETTYNPGQLNPNTTYYWRIDEVLAENFRTDLTELARMAENWLADNCQEPIWCNGADWNMNGSVDFGDVAELAADWLVLTDTIIGDVWNFTTSAANPANPDFRVYLEYEDVPNAANAWNAGNPTASVPLTVDSAGDHWTRTWTAGNVTRSSDAAVGDYSYAFDGSAGMAVRLLADGSSMFSDDTYTLMKSNFTIAFWMKSTNLTWGTVIMRDHAAIDYRGIMLETTSTGNLRARFQDNASNVQSYDIPGVIDGTWHHVAITLDATDGMKWYKDGVLVKSSAVAGFSPEFHYNLPIGCNSAGSQRYIGNLDDVRIYSIALDANAINDIYNIR